MTIDKVYLDFSKILETTFHYIFVVMTEKMFLDNGIII